MIKKLNYLFLIIIMIFANISIVHASDCSDIGGQLTLYDDYTKVLDTLNVNDTDDIETVSRYNTYAQKRNLIITKLMKLNEKGAICSNQQSKVDQIIKENEGRCGKIFDSGLNDFVDKMMTIFYILGPILLILFGSLDYTKAVVSSEADAMKKANKNFIRRLIATILLFLTPVIVNLIISLNISNKYLSGNAYSCEFNYLVYSKKYQITYIPRKKRTQKDKTLFVGGIKTEEERVALEEELTQMLNTTIHSDGSNQQGPFAKWWSSDDDYNLGIPFQCPWWAWGRASQYLATYGTKYDKFPESNDGYAFYSMNQQKGWFKYGKEPRPNSIISWSGGTAACGSNGSIGCGHVAYVEGVTDDGIYISHAGSGKSWKGITKIPLSGYFASGYQLNGYIYLDEPIE